MLRTPRPEGGQNDEPQRLKDVTPDSCKKRMLRTPRPEGGQNDEPPRLKDVTPDSCKDDTA